MAPIVYTPTVGWAALNHHRLFRRPRGFYFSLDDLEGWFCFLSFPFYSFLFPLFFFFF